MSLANKYPCIFALVKRWKMRYKTKTLICFWLSYSVFVSCSAWKAVGWQWQYSNYYYRIFRTSFFIFNIRWPWNWNDDVVLTQDLQRLGQGPGLHGQGGGTAQNSQRCQPQSRLNGILRSLLRRAVPVRRPTQRGVAQETDVGALRSVYNYTVVVKRVEKDWNSIFWP